MKPQSIMEDYFASDDFVALSMAAQLPVSESKKRVVNNEEAVFDLEHYILAPRDQIIERELLPHLIERMNNLLVFDKYCSDFEIALWG